MKKLIGACLLALPLLVLPSKAHAWGCGGCCCGGCGCDVCGTVGGCFSNFINCFCHHGCGPCAQGPASGGASPWYTYWPYEAHFQTPAPYCWPYWPDPSTASGVAPYPTYAGAGYQPAPEMGYGGAYGAGFGY